MNPIVLSPWESLAVTACRISRVTVAIRGCIAGVTATGRPSAGQRRSPRSRFSAFDCKRGNPIFMASEPKKPASRRSAKRPTVLRTPKRKAVTSPYVPAPQEEAAIEVLVAQKKEMPHPPRMKTSMKGGEAQILFDHPDPALEQALLLRAVGSTDFDFLEGLLKQLVNAGTQGPKADERGINFMLSVIKGVEPNDQVEAMLAAQMAAVHMATMTFARHLAHVDSIPQQDSAERAFNKLARTFAAQVEALKRYRTGGEQRVTAAR